ncbi:MAG: endonuclease/exonuclease/phosphatase family protein [Paracoccaceae bacterium]
MATYNADLSRKGPGLLARDIAGGQDAQVAAVVAVLAATAPDILLITELDWDAQSTALMALQQALAAAGQRYDHTFAFQPNTGIPTGFDLDGDGNALGPRDAQGYGRFSGHRGMAILSKRPIDREGARDMSALLWRDLPQGRLADARLPEGAEAVLRLSTTGHWDVPVTLGDGQVLHLLAWSGAPPAFPPLSTSIARNHDETAFWLRYLDGDLPWPAPETPFVILGDANSDIADGGGDPVAMAALLSDPRLTDPLPTSPGGLMAALPDKNGDPALDTADWAANRNVKDNLRVDYVLPSADLRVTAAGVFWPLPDDPMARIAATASPHRLVWVDITLP